MNETIRADVERTLGALSSVRPISGGCISPSFRVVHGDGRTLFIKTATHGWPADAFAAESAALEALRASSTLVVPRVYGCGASWLALEWLEPVKPTAMMWRELGQKLARLHRTTQPTYGWPIASYLGPLPQSNNAAAQWAEFWREQRLRPLLERAAPQLSAQTRHDFEQLLSGLDELLRDCEEDGASLLHGDLWNGNVHMSTRGAGVIDPASYYGHREVDLAMAALFGGFPREFLEGYESEWPLLPGAQTRQPVYQLYYLLVHVVLFGGSYVNSTRATLRTALSQ